MAEQELPEKIESVESSIESWYSVDDLVKLSEASLSPQMLHFCHAFCSGLSPTQAAKKAGYGAKAGNYLIQNPRVQEEIRTRQSMMVMAAEVKKEGIMSELLKLYHKLGEDHKSTELKLKCLDMLNKVSGFYSPETLINVANQIQNISIEIVKPDKTKKLGEPPTL